MRACRSSERLKPARARAIDERRPVWAIALMLGPWCVFPVCAHDFWVQPKEYWTQPGTPMPFTLQVGHGPDRQRSPIRFNRIGRFEALAPGGATLDLRNDIQLGGATDDGFLQFQIPGTYMLLLETDNRGRSALPASVFEEYARTEGLTPALEQRKRAGHIGADPSESYRRVAKCIVQVGPVNETASSHITKALGLPLEIVPERSPYTQPRVENLPVRVVFEGRPLAGALVKLTNLENDAEPLEVHRTDLSGRARFRLPPGGRWLLNVVWTKPLPPAADVDFDTTFSSLSFGFPVTRETTVPDRP